MKKTFAVAGALLSAVLASACCLGPLVLAVLGFGGAGAAAGLEKYRPFFLGASALLLAAAFVQVYRRRDACAAGSCSAAGGGAGAKLALWLAAVAALALATFPSWTALMTRRAHPPIAAAQAIKLSVSGMDCPACAAGIVNALKKVPGVKDASLDYSKSEATVYAEKDQVAGPALVKAIQGAGPYTAKIEESN